MPWNPAHFHPLAFSLLETQSTELLPLSANAFQPQDLPTELITTPPAQLFPYARDPQAALAGLLLIAGRWDLCHQMAQDIPSREGSYWHAIAHRIEPHSSNARYWFERVGEHPIFAALYEQASVLLASSNSGWRLESRWNSNLFIAWCDEARTSDAKKQILSQQIQRAEFDLLFSWCALKIKDL